MHVISIGSELTLGQTVDTNAAWIARRLAEIGVRCERFVVVADDLASIAGAIDHSATHADALVMTGGLGPTADDLTREAIALAADAPLELDPRSLEHLREFFARRNRSMPDANRGQAMIPRGGAAIPNPTGTAPGVAIRIRACRVFALPGVPFEMKAMFDADVLPVLASLGGAGVLRSRIIRTYGLPESELGAKIADLMKRGRNPEVGTTAELGEIGVRINARAPNPSDADRLLDVDEAEIRLRLGGAVYGRDADTLASAVGAMLSVRRRTVVTAESCTGGMIAALLTDVPGSSAYYRGGVVAYDNGLKQSLLGVSREMIEAHGAVSAEVASAMAAGARSRLAADYAVAVTGIAGPTGGSPDKPVGLVYIAVADAEQVNAREFRFGDDQSRQTVRTRAARTALNLLRRMLVEKA